MERRDLAGNITEEKETGKILAKTVATGLALTVKPCNPKCKTWLMNDLTKSDLTMPPPAVYWEALQKAPATSSFRDHSGQSDFQVYLKLEKLKKSLDNYVRGFTDMRCDRCGRGIRFFKSTKDMPNACTHCGNHFSLTKIWGALNK